MWNDYPVTMLWICYLLLITFYIFKLCICIPALENCMIIIITIIIMISIIMEGKGYVQLTVTVNEEGESKSRSKSSYSRNQTCLYYHFYFPLNLRLKSYLNHIITHKLPTTTHPNRHCCVCRGKSLTREMKNNTLIIPSYPSIMIYFIFPLTDFCLCSAHCSLHPLTFTASAFVFHFE